MRELGCTDGCGWEMGSENCADGCGRRGCNGVAGNGWGEEAAGDERAWLRGRLRTGNGCGIARTAADGVGQFFLNFWRPTSISRVRVAMDASKSQFFLSFWRPTSISCERVEMDASKSQFFLRFWRPTSISCEAGVFCTFWLENVLRAVVATKKCTPLWREAHFQVKMLKTPGVRTTFGSWDVEKVHAAVARSTFRSQYVQNTTCSRRFWTFRCRFAWQAPCQKWAKLEDFVAVPKTMAGVGHLKRVCKDAFSVAGAVQETCSSEMLGGQGADFLRGAAFWSIRASGLLRWFCLRGATLRMAWPHFFVAGAVL